MKLLGLGAFSREIAFQISRENYPIVSNPATSPFFHPSTNTTFFSLLFLHLYRRCVAAIQ